MNYFKIICLATAILFIYLFFQLLFKTESFINGIGLPSCETATILVRRTSVFMIGISILMFSSNNLHHSKARQYICIATGITMIGLACDGSYELMKGTVNSSMLTAIIIETVIGVSFLIIFLKNIKVKTTSS